MNEGDPRNDPVAGANSKELACAAAAAWVARPVERPETCRKTSVALIDEFPLRRSGTQNLLRAHIRIGTCPFGATADLLRHLSSGSTVHCCVIVCIGARSVTEPPIAEQLRLVGQALMPAPMIVMSDREEHGEVVAAFRSGARGFIPTHLEPRLVATAIRIVLAGGAFVPAGAWIRPRVDAAPETVAPADPLEEVAGPVDAWPPRQFEVLRGLVRGMTNREIAQHLHMEESTVKVHVRHITRKLGVTNRTEAALRARRLGIVADHEGTSFEPAGHASVTPGVSQVLA